MPDQSNKSTLFDDVPLFTIFTDSNGDHFFRDDFSSGRAYFIVKENGKWTGGPAGRYFPRKEEVTLLEPLMTLHELEKGQDPNEFLPDFRMAICENRNGSRWDTTIFFDCADLYAEVFAELRDWERTEIRNCLIARGFDAIQTCRTLESLYPSLFILWTDETNHGWWHEGRQVGASALPEE